MAGQEHRRVVNQGGILTTEQDRVFADLLRRLLMKAVQMIEDRYGLTPVSHERREERARAVR